MHMETPKLQNAACLSPQTQNEMIDVTGTHIMQAKIVKEIKDAQIYTTMVDEVTSHHVELMPLCIWFVDKNHDIREELLEICVTVSLCQDKATRSDQVERTEHDAEADWLWEWGTSIPTVLWGCTRLNSTEILWWAVYVETVVSAIHPARPASLHLTACLTFSIVQTSAGLVYCPYKNYQSVSCHHNDYVMPVLMIMAVYSSIYSNFIKREIPDTGVKCSAAPGEKYIACQQDGTGEKFTLWIEKLNRAAQQWQLLQH